MPRPVPYLLILLLGSLLPGLLSAQAMPYEEAVEKAEALLAEMTVEEKVGQLLADFPDKQSQPNPLAGFARQYTWFSGGRGPAERARAYNEHQRRVIENSRLGIPVLAHDEALHGLTGGDFTSFPMPIGLAAMFDVELMEEVAEVIATEVEATGTRQVLSPVLNLVRDPRWGRTGECYGESAYLASEYAVAFVEAMESRGIVCAMKHFVANYGDGGRDSDAMFVDEYLLRNYWLRPFEAAVKRGGARSVMAAYNSLNGLPAHQNHWLLTELLRDEWGFEGFTVADYNGWLVGRWHNTVPDFDATFKAVFEAGLNVPLHRSIQHLERVVGLVESGELPEAIIDQRVREVLATKYAIGLFDQPIIDEARLVEVTRAPKHLALADRAYEQSQVLLKNDGVLPIDPDAVERIGFSGPVAEKVKFGDYSRWPMPSDLSPMDGLREIASEVEFVDLDKAADPIAEARSCDAILYFASVEEGEAKDRAYFGLQPVEGLASAVQEYDDEGSFIYDEGQAAGVEVDQNAQIRGLATAGPPVVVVLVTSSPVDVGPFVDRVAAIHQAWDTNSRGALALGRILFGEVNPAGRLPMTWAAHPGQLPIYHDFYPYGRGSIKYVDDSGKPRYPFGYGLSYTRFEYADLRVEPAPFGFEVRFRVSNTGDRAGTVVPQLYLRDVIASSVRPMQELQGFTSIDLEAGESREIVLRLSAEELDFYNLAHDFIVEPGEFTIRVGDNAEDIRLEATVALPAESLPLSE